jgi:hypothetical protein
MALIDNTGRQIPFFVKSYSYEHIATENFDPITRGVDGLGTLNASQLGKYTRNGFLVRPNTDGILCAITHDQYIRNHKSLTGLTPQNFLGLANTWIECPLIKVYAKSDATYGSTSDYINVACI